MSKTRNIYFVRHGQTDANVGDIPQSNEATLTNHGHEQAKILAQRLTHLQIDAIYSSPLTRAKETAQYIADSLGVKYEVLDLLTERKKPSEQLGLSRKEGKGLEILKAIENNWGRVDWHYSDEENFYDLHKRLIALVDYLHHHTAGDIICVTHGYLLRLLTCYVLTNSDNPADYLHSIESVKFENTGITHIRIKENGHWQFRSINDSTHLS